MCGICGKVSSKGVTRDQIQTMNDVLAHRGPDDEGLYVDNTVGLAQRRLSIIDIAGGHQPMSNGDGTLQIVFNGEIYNYKELREKLAGSHQFATNSDTEVVLHLYEDKGEACLDDLRGMFAFALWDSKNRTMFVARDHLGQKPMFYTHENGDFAFASEIKSLLADDPSLRKMNAEALHQYLTLRVIAPPRTIYEGVNKLPPGHKLIWKEGKIRIERYWSLNYEPKLDMSESHFIDELDQKMLETVKYHMVSDVPVGAFLSGGLDSSIIVGMMSKVTDQQFKTFSVGVPYEDYSELPYARAIAEKYGTDHHEDTIIPSLVRIMPELVWHLDEPSDSLSAAMYYISEMASKHVKVVLGGDGGDELFGGYDRYYGQRYVEYYAMAPKPIRKYIMGQIVKMIPDGFWYKSTSQKLKWINQLSLVDKSRRYARSLGHFYFNEEFRDELYADRLTEAVNRFDPEEAINHYFASDNAKDLVDRMLYADSMIRLPDHSVMIGDRTTMAHGLEGRSPFMDHKLAEFCAQIPSSLKVKGRTRRYIPMRIAERYMPPDVLNRKKQGFSSALPYLLADEFRFLFETFLKDSHLVRDGYLKQAGINRLLSEHLGRKVDHGNRLWLLCNSEIWYRMAIEGVSRDEMKEIMNPEAMLVS